VVSAFNFSSLIINLNQLQPKPMSMNFLKDDCYDTANMNCFCIEFHFEGRRRGFHTSQLIEYTLEPNPDAKDDDGGTAQAAPDKLAFAFSTADVIVLGWRLGRIADYLRENKLAAVGTHPKRYAELDRNKPFVASIKIEPVKQ
jgi:hypothetical protein